MFNIWEVGIYCEIMWLRTATVLESSERSNETLVSLQVVWDRVVEDRDHGRVFWTFSLIECGLIVPPLVSNFTRILLNPKFHYHVHRSMSLVPILSQITLVFYSLSSSFIIISFSFYLLINASFCKVVCFIWVSQLKSCMRCFSSPYFIQALLPYKGKEVPLQA
jgi:hypothetical protein